MFKKDYAYKLMEKENKRLTVENQTLRNKLQEVETLKTQYDDLISDLKEYKEKYKNALKEIEKIEATMRKDLETVIKQ